MIKVKDRFPFRAGCTSYVIPDHIIPNVEFMGPYVDDIELVLFESPLCSNLPSEDDIKHLMKLADKYSLTYSIHFPTTHRAGDDTHELFMNDLIRVHQLTDRLSPSAWILHLEGICREQPEQDSQWLRRSQAVLAGLDRIVNEMPYIAIENLSYPWRLHLGLAERHRASLCLDIGHLWINSPESWVDNVIEMLPRTSVIHLHGLHEGRDHLSLMKTDMDDLKLFVSIIKRTGYSGLVTLEVFSQQDTEESLQLLHDIWFKA